MITKDDILNAAKCCAEGSCGNCPLLEHRYGLEDCVKVFVNYILCNIIKENESALVTTNTSSTKKENTFQINDSTKSDICQVLASAMSTLLTLYQEMESQEKKAFDLGGIYKDICCASAWMNNVRKDDDSK